MSKINTHMSSVDFNQLRKKVGFRTQEQTGKAMGVSGRTIWKYEQQKIMPMYLALSLQAYAFDLELTGAK